MLNLVGLWIEKKIILAANRKSAGRRSALLINHTRCQNAKPIFFKFMSSFSTLVYYTITQRT